MHEFQEQWDRQRKYGCHCSGFVKNNHSPTCPVHGHLCEEQETKLRGIAEWLRFKAAKYDEIADKAESA